MGAKLKATVVLIFVFGLGIASGIAWEIHQSRHTPPRMMFGERRLARLKKELQLKPGQEENLREIVQDARDRANDLQDAMDYDLAKVRADSLEEIQSLLSDEQRAQFKLLRERRRAKHRPTESQIAAQPDATPKTTLASANKDVQTAQNELHVARENYLNAVRTSGPDSPQALSAKTRMDTARSSWRNVMSSRQNVRRQARRELNNHRGEQAPRTDPQ